jgi:hypothetical protein
MHAIHWLAETIAGNVIGLILAIVVAAMLAYLKDRGRAVAYGLVGFLLVIGIWAGFHAISYLSYASQRVKPVVTEDNVESKIREWAYAFGATVTKVSGPEASGTIFAMNITPEDGASSVRVARPQQFSHYVVVASSLTLSPEHQKLRDQMDSTQIRQLTEEVRLEMSRCRVAYAIESPLKRVTVQRLIPITDDLTEDVFMDRIAEMQHDVNLAADTIILGLERRAREKQKPLHHMARKVRPVDR